MDLRQIAGSPSSASSQEHLSVRSDPLESWTSINLSETRGFLTRSFLTSGSGFTFSENESTPISCTSGTTKDACADQKVTIAKSESRSVVQNDGINLSRGGRLPGHQPIKQREKDVLLGEGPGCYNHPGTVAMKVCVHKEQCYYKSPERINSERTQVRNQIYEDFKRSGARFWHLMRNQILGIR